MHPPPLTHPESFPRDPTTGTKANSNVGVTVGTLQGKLVSRTDANALVEIMPEDLQPKPMFTYTDINPAFKVCGGEGWGEGCMHGGRVG